MPRGAFFAPHTAKKGRSFPWRSPRDHDRAESRPRGRRTSLNVASSTYGARPVDTSTAPKRPMRLRRRWLLISCALDLLEKTQRRWRDSRCSVPVADMHPILFVSSPHVQNTSFCVGDASRMSYTYTSFLYSRAVPCTNRHARATKRTRARAQRPATSRRAVRRPL